MKNPHTDLMNKKNLGLALALVVGAAVYRLISATFLTGLPNFSPVMAMAFCCGLFLPGALAAAVPLGCLFVSDLLLNAHFGQPLVSVGMVAAYACYLFAIGSGTLLRGRGLLPLFGAVLGNAVLFYVVTNTMSWLGNVQYAQSVAGWVQALTVGLPGFPSTWTFFRNSVLSDLLFTGMFLALFYRAKNRSASPNLCRQESSS